MPAMRGPLRFLSGHLGAAVSALVDGQLDDESTERAWEHVLTCPPCHRLVEREGWVKRQLAQIGETPQAERPSEQLLGSLLDLDPALVAWADTEDLAAPGRSLRRAGLVLVGAGSVSAAVLGLTTLGGLSLGPDRVPVTSIGGAGASSTPTRAVVAPVAAVHGRLPGWTLGSRDPGVAHATAVGVRR